MISKHAQLVDIGPLFDFFALTKCRSCKKQNDILLFPMMLVQECRHHRLILMSQMKNKRVVLNL